MRDMPEDRILKGRIAEAIVEAMLEEMGWKVYRYGAEFTANAVLDRNKPNTGTAALRVRRMPDFIIQKEREVHLIEVKYRAEGSKIITKEYIEEWKKPFYPESFVIVVSPFNGILIQKADKIYEHGQFVLLTDIPELGFDRKIALEYYGLAQKIFKVVEEALGPKESVE